MDGVFDWPGLDGTDDTWWGVGPWGPDTRDVVVLPRHAQKLGKCDMHCIILCFHQGALGTSRTENILVLSCAAHLSCERHQHDRQYHDDDRASVRVQFRKTVASKLVHSLPRGPSALRSCCSSITLCHTDRRLCIFSSSDSCHCTGVRKSVEVLWSWGCGRHGSKVHRRNTAAKTDQPKVCTHTPPHTAVQR
eukprot:COSAG02_NODE_1562_length_11922_cov_3.632411_4_plen_192_part_00